MAFKMKGKSKFDFGNKGKFNFNKKNNYSGKKYPKNYTKEDIQFLKDQREDVVREEDKK